jgi:hypothetical protein
MIPPAERIVEFLSQQQHLFPHQPVADAVAKAVDQFAVCPEAAEAAVTSLAVDSRQAVGRLRRTELIQLGRTVHRLWRQNVASTPAPTQQR